MDLLSREGRLGRIVVEEDVVGRDIMYLFCGVDSETIEVRETGGEAEVVVDRRASKDSRRVVEMVEDIVLGVREVQRFLSDALYTKERMRQSMGHKALQAFLKVFFGRVHVVWKRGGEVSSLPQVFESEVYAFREVRRMLRDVEGLSGGGLVDYFVEVVGRRGGGTPLSLALLGSVLRPFNVFLSLFLEGKDVADASGEFFARCSLPETEEGYGFDDCYWSMIYTLVPGNVPSILLPYAKSIVVAAKCVHLLKMAGSGSTEYSETVPALLVAEGNRKVYFDAEAFSGIYRGAMEKTMEVVRGSFAESLALIKKVFLFGEFRRYAELFGSLGFASLRCPDEDVTLALNSILNRDGEDDILECYGDDQSYADVTISEVSAFDIFAEDVPEAKHLREGEVLYTLSSATFTQMLLKIHNVEAPASSLALSLLKGLDVLYKPKAPFSLFFTPKSLAGYRIIFRFIYSLYAVEYFASRTPQQNRIRYVITLFTSGLRMYIMERVINREWEVLQGSLTENVDQNIALQEEYLRKILRGSLLTDVELIRIYDLFFTLTFRYLEVEEKNSLPGEYLDELWDRYQEVFRRLYRHLLSTHSEYLTAFIHSFIKDKGGEGGREGREKF